MAEESELREVLFRMELVIDAKVTDVDIEKKILKQIAHLSEVKEVRESKVIAHLE
jgi:hypothetical protein